MRRFFLIAAGLIVAGSAHSAGNVLDGIPIRGDVGAVSAADIRAAIMAVRSEDPEAKHTRIREIRVVNHAKIYFVHTPMIHGSEGRFEAELIKGRWHYASTYIGPP